MKQVNQSLLKKLIARRNTVGAGTNFRLVVLTNDMTADQSEEAIFNIECPGVITFIADFTGETVPYDHNKIRQSRLIENESMSIVYR